MKIVVGLVEHLGDIVACEPVARYLRSEYPNCQIAWAVKTSFRELVDSNPHIDETIVVECLTDWIKLINHVPYDRVVDLHVNGRVCSHCGIPLYKKQGNPFVNAFEWFDHGAILEAFSEGAGLPKLSSQPFVYIGDDIVQNVDKLSLEKDFCVIHTSSNDTTKDWSQDNWQSLIDWLSEAYGLVVVRVGRLGDREVLSNVVDVRGKTTILETAQIIKRARAFIGVDSGPAHLANAVQTPSVILLGRLGYFRQYNPFTGYLASDLPTVKIVRNLTGPVKSLTFEEVRSAVAYVLAACKLSADGDQMVFSDRATVSVPATTSQVKYPKVFAFYLPQFHPIAENDFAHGPGFTEWTNVLKARPLYHGHYQPRMPGELGFYDLRSSDVMRAQIELAVTHGIDGFCFYYYYFKGKKLLYKPIENYIRSESVAPYLFVWANENWTRRWDGGDQEVIIRQEHSSVDDEIFLNELLPVFRDDRYVKVSGKPVLMVYKAHLLPNPARTAELWRVMVEKAGFPGIYLVMVDDWQAISHPRDLGFDATYEIPSNIVPDNLMVENLAGYLPTENFDGKLVDYYKFSSFHTARPFPLYKRLRTVMAPWDNTARYGNRAMVHVNSDNDSYRNWLTAAYVQTYARYSGDERLLFLHSWNEWCEGTYIEPDGRTGRARLQDSSSAVSTGRDIVDLHRLMGGDPLVLNQWQQLEKKREAGSYLLTKYLQTRGDYFAGEAHLLRQEALELRKTLANIEKSKAWKLTAPLRRLRGTLLSRKRP